MTYQTSIACPHCGGDLQPDGPLECWCRWCNCYVPFDQVTVFMEPVDDDE